MLKFYRKTNSPVLYKNRFSLIPRFTIASSGFQEKEFKLHEDLTKNPNFNYDLYKQIYGENEEKLELVVKGKERKVGYWLLVCAGCVVFMTLWGGYTRLSNSGLSMTKWKPLNLFKPKSDEQWKEEFEHYKVNFLTKQFPEYKISNQGMDLQAFKKIYYVEWFHRHVGSSLGFIFGAPFLYFAARGYLRRKMLIRCSLLFLMV